MKPSTLFDESSNSTAANARWSHFRGSCVITHWVCHTLSHRSRFGDTYGMLKQKFCQSKFEFSSSKCKKASNLDLITYQNAIMNSSALQTYSAYTPWWTLGAIGKERFGGTSLMAVHFFAVCVSKFPISRQCCNFQCSTYNEVRAASWKSCDILWYPVMAELPL